MGNAVAVRTFNALSVNLDIVKEVGTRLLEVSADGHGPIPIWLQATDLKPAMQVTPLLVDTVGDQIVPRNLQVRLQEYLATDAAATMVKCLAKSLASLHRRQVVHGNLKPGNIFISEEGRIMVSDYCLGLMPGIDFLGFSDALLYMSPEQLRDPNGFHKEAGYRWDVFAFGVLAFRFLEGRFPRCHESFDDVAPAPGVMQNEGVEADYPDVADQLFAANMEPWELTQDEILKKLVTRCLDLDPQNRFRDMVELCEVWERETQAVRHASEMEVMARKLRKDRSRKRKLTYGLAASLAVGASLAALWLSREYILQSDRERAVMAKNIAEKEAEGAEAAEAIMREEKLELTDSLANSEGTITLLSESRDELLDWALAEGGPDLPVLLGREGRLKLLDKRYQDLLKNKNLSQQWRQKWIVERALIALARGQDEQARKLVKDEVHLLGGRGMTTLLLRESVSEGVPKEELSIARGLVKKMKEPARPWLESALDLVEVRSLEHSGQQDRSLRMLAELGERVRILTAEVPGTCSLWRTRLQREAAEVAEGAGRVELAHEFREAMIAELRNDLGVAGLDEVTRRKLSEQFVIVAEGLAETDYALGNLKAARSLSEESLKMVPESGQTRVEVALAVHHAVIAGCQREAGLTEEAKASLETALSLISGKIAKPGDKRWAEYREGMLKWQLSGVLGQSGDATGEMKMGEEALQMMQDLLASGESRPSPIQVNHVIGYLCGDMVQAFESAGEQEKANKFLDEAMSSWKFLLAANPEEPEYAAGLAWCEELKNVQ